MDEEILSRELKYKAVRSGGAGGQHVNKVATKVVLTLDLANSQAFDEFEKNRLLEKIGNRLSGDHKLILFSDSTRSQAKNKELVTKRFNKLIKDSLKVPKKTKKSAPTRAAVEKRLNEKKKVAEKKSTRKKPPLNL